MDKPLIVDLFCKAGGMSKGFSDAGFDVVGVDINPQPNYPFRFIQADVLHVWSWIADAGYPNIAAIHASPPCQAHSRATRRWGMTNKHLNLIPHTREILRALGIPYIIENVEGAPLLDPITLCGSMFGLRVRRHRLFETNFPVSRIPECRHREQGPVVGVYGHSGGSSKRDGITFGSSAEWRSAMGIDWMTNDELREAIPPAYSFFIGRQLMEHVRVSR